MGVSSIDSLLFTKEPLVSYIGSGMVIYCDGGNFRENPGPYGCGLHWYTYSNKPYAKFPVNGLFPTTLGYWEGKNPETEGIKEFPTVNSVEEFREVFIRTVEGKKTLNDKPYLVFIEKMKEYSRGFPTPGSNNLAELEAMKKALAIILEEKVDFTLLYCDSQYVLGGLKQVDKWAKENWMSSTGKPLSNKEQWLDIHYLLQQIREQKLHFAPQWIKGHGDAKADKRTLSNIANVFADKMATIAANLANNLKYQVDLTQTQGILESDITLEDLAREKKPPKPHPLLSNKRMYLSYQGREDKSIFYLGDPGTITAPKKMINGVEKKLPIDLYTGKMIADTQIAILYLEGGDPIVNMIEEVQDIWLKQHYQHNNLIYCLQMDNITSSKVYSALHKYGKYYLCRPKGVPNLETIDGKGLTYVNDPIYLAMRNIDHLTELSHVLSHYVNKAEHIREIDLTEYFYTTKEMIVEKDIRGNENQKVALGKSLLKTLGTDVISIKPKIQFDNGVEKEITLSFGVDLPLRNQFKQIEDEMPLVKLLLWHESGAVYRYATFIALHEKVDSNTVRLKNYMIVRGTYSSQFLAE